MDKQPSVADCENDNSNERNQLLLENISQLLQVINQKGLKPEKRLDKILNIILRYLGVEQGSIMVVKKTNLMVVAATRKKIIGIKQPIADGSIASFAATSKQPVFVADIDKDSRFASKKRGGKSYKKNSVLSVPILQEGKTLAVINVTDKLGDKDLLKEDITYLLDFSSMLISSLVQQELQDKLRRKKNTLKKRNQELKRQEEMRDELYRMLIHDLKAPLAEVVANLDILSYSVEGENKDFLEAAQIGCDRTVRMVSNLVTINQIEDGNLIPFKEEVDPKLLLDEAYSAIKGLAAIKSIKLILEVEDGLPTIYLDRILILRVLQNLLTNALGYSNPETTITIGCSQVPGKKKLEFFVQDQGDGLSKMKRMSVFEKYTRLSDKQDSLVGTGLGLYFCKLAVDIHQGIIDIESEPGMGCRFFFQLTL